jgi:hypothetical protein
MKNFKLLVLLLLSTLAVGLTACESKSGNIQPTLKWRAYTLKDHKLVFVENTDSLSVLTGDTVTCIAFDDSPYEITNEHQKYDDGVDYIPVIDSTGQDTLECLRIERITVVLANRILRQ